MGLSLLIMRVSKLNHGSKRGIGSFPSVGEPFLYAIGKMRVKIYEPFLAIIDIDVT